MDFLPVMLERENKLKKKWKTKTMIVMKMMIWNFQLL